MNTERIDSDSTQTERESTTTGTGQALDHGAEELRTASLLRVDQSSMPVDLTIPWDRVVTDPGLFNPQDPWAVHSRAGLLTLTDWNGMRVAEVGIGTGVTAGVLLREFPDIRAFFGSDLNERALEFAAPNIATIAPNANGAFIGLPGSNDLLSGFLGSNHFDSTSPETRLDRVYGCIPQMLAPEEGFVPPADALAHYIKPTDASGYSVIDQHGLALNARLLAQAASVLQENGSVVLTLSGRPPWHVVEYMFERYGFTQPVRLHTALVVQDPGTSIDQLARIERASVHGDLRFEFWGRDDLQDRPGFSEVHPEIAGSHLEVRSDRRPMNAREARAVLEAGGEVFHHVHVVEGRLK